MNKWIWRVASLLMVIALFTGCGANEEKQSSNQNESQTSEQSNTESEQKNEETVKITISKNNGEEQIKEEEIEIEDGAILLEVMKNNFKVKEDGGFITSINGIAPKENEEKAWMYTVNGEMAKVGAAELELSPGDHVVFDLHAY